PILSQGMREDGYVCKRQAFSAVEVRPRVRVASRALRGAVRGSRLRLLLRQLELVQGAQERGKSHRASLGRCLRNKLFGHSITIRSECAGPGDLPCPLYRRVQQTARRG